MGMYLCRREDGDFSLVKATDRTDALEKLWTEGENAEGLRIFRLEECMLHFHLTDEGELEFSGFALGDGTESEIYQKAYPILDEVKLNAERDQQEVDWTPRGKEQIRAAVEQERSRVKARKVREPRDTVARSIKQQLDLPTAMVERHQKQAIEQAAETAFALAERKGVPKKAEN
jgi:hypothetical protein